MVNVLVDPLFICWLSIAGASTYLWIKKAGGLVPRAIATGAVVLLWALATAGPANLLMAALEQGHGPVLAHQMPNNLGAVVVLGGGVDPGFDPWAQGVGNEDKASIAAEAYVRLVNGARLAGELEVPLVLSGGSVWGKPAESAIAEGTIRGLGLDGEIPEILIEKTSRNTHENAQFTSELLSQEAMGKSMALVTSAYHMERALGSFRGAGLDPIPFPVGHQSHGWSGGATTPSWWYYLLPNTNSLELSSRGLREVFARIQYRILGRIK